MKGKGEQKKEKTTSPAVRIDPSIYKRLRYHVALVGGDMKAFVDKTLDSVLPDLPSQAKKLVNKKSS